MLRAGGETGTKQDNIKDWFRLDEGNPVFQPLVFAFVLKQGSMAFFFSFLSALSILLRLSIYLSWLCVLGAVFYFTNPDDLPNNSSGLAKVFCTLYSFKMRCVRAVSMPIRALNTSSRLLEYLRSRSIQKWDREFESHSRHDCSLCTHSTLSCVIV